MEKTKEEKIALLNETIAYYSENVLRRCLYDNGQCFYFGANNKKTESDGCAIGRLIPKELAEQLDKEFIYDIEISGVNNIFDRLPIELQAYGFEFLCNLQSLHDGAYNWCKEGLTEEGEDYVEKILNNLDKFHSK